MSRYNKLIGALVGNVVAIALAWVAVQFPGAAQCTVDPTVGEICSAFGLTQAELTAGLMFLLNSALVYLFPPNRPA